MNDPKFIAVPDHPLIELNNKPGQQVPSDLIAFWHIGMEFAEYARAQSETIF